VSAAGQDRLSSHRSFRLHWRSKVLATVAFRMATVAFGWQLYALTGSAWSLGIIGLVQFLPIVPLTLVVGHVADRHDRRLVVAVCDIVQGLTLAALALATALGSLDAWYIYAAALVVGVVRAFDQPTMAAMLPSLLPERLLSRGIASSSSAGQVANILGPALGGLLFAQWDVAPYALGALSSFVALAGMLALPARRPQAAGGSPTLASIFSGLAFIRARPVLLGAISLDMVAVLLGGATALLPIYASDILQVGPWGLGMLRSAPAVGALAAAAWLARAPIRRAMGRTMIVSVAIFGLATMAFAVSTSLVLSLVALTVLGAADNVSVVIRNHLVQMATPDEMRGRVFAAFGLFTGTSNQLGEFESGVTAEWWGAVAATLIGGAGTLAVALAWRWVFPAIVRVDQAEAVR
jgi:MFS family permease